MMHVQVTLLNRPLPPGEGRGEGLRGSGSEVNHRQSIKNSPHRELTTPSSPSPPPPPHRGNTAGGSTTARSPVLGRTPALPHSTSALRGRWSSPHEHGRRRCSDS